MQRLLIFFFLSVFSSIPVGIKAQFGFEFKNDIPVTVNGNQLNNAWGGGLNYVQMSDFDFDQDGDMDLFCFDRSSNNIRVFIHQTDNGHYYTSAFNIQDLFPSDLKYRATMVDYNNDGKKDLFTYGLNGLKVYKNISNAIDGLQWQLESDLLYSQYPNNYSNLAVSSADIPGIVDVDKDGDIDILTFSMGGQHVEYHQNQSIELYGHSDSLIFELKNECWGKFSEDVTTNNIILNDPNSPCGSSVIPNPELVENNSFEKEVTRHAGSTLLAIDLDNSGVLDLILGDVAYTNLNLLINGGTQVNTDSPMVSSDPNFPSNTTPVDMHLFPAAFFIDVDFDGVKDLIVGANAKAVSENEKSIWFYKNHGTNELPNFLFSTRSFLQNEMIEHGSGSIPTFTDINEDGLEDLIVTNLYRYKATLDKESSIAYYRNTGTSSAPAFTLVDDNYLNIPGENFGFRSVPAFGDIDTDGDEDLLLGLEDGTIVYYRNESSGNGAVYSIHTQSLTDANSTVIDVGAYAFPQLFDLDNDGLKDLIIGNRAGNIAYYKNTGTASAFEFTLVNALLGNIDVSTTSPDGYATPLFFREGNKLHLFCGSVDGKLIYYDSIENNLSAGNDFRLVNASYLTIDVQKYSSFFVNDINGNGELDLFVGQDLGGIYHLESNPNSSISLIENHVNDDIHIYPNPAHEKIHIKSEVHGLESMEIYSIDGKIQLSQDVNSMNTQMDISGLESGTYILLIKGKRATFFSKRFVKK